MPKPWEEALFDPDEGLDGDEWDALWDDVRPGELEFGVHVGHDGVSVFVRPVGVEDWDQEIPFAWVEAHMPAGVDDQVMESTFAVEELGAEGVVARLTAVGFRHNGSMDTNDLPTVGVSVERAQEMMREFQRSYPAIAQAVSRQAEDREHPIAVEPVDPQVWVNVLLYILLGGAYSPAMTAPNLIAAVLARCTVVERPHGRWSPVLGPLTAQDRDRVTAGVVVAISRGPFEAASAVRPVQYRVRDADRRLLADTAGATLVRRREEDGHLREIVFDFNRASDGGDLDGLEEGPLVEADYAELEARVVAASPGPRLLALMMAIEGVMDDGGPWAAAQIHTLLVNAGQLTPSEEPTLFRRALALLEATGRLEAVEGDGYQSMATVYRLVEDPPGLGMVLAVLQRRDAGNGLTAEAVHDLAEGLSMGQVMEALTHMVGSGQALQLATSPPTYRAVTDMDRAVREAVSGGATVDNVQARLVERGVSLSRQHVRRLLDGLLGVGAMALERRDNTSVEAGSVVHTYHGVVEPTEGVTAEQLGEVMDRAEARGMLPHQVQTSDLELPGQELEAAIIEVVRGRGVLTAADIHTALITSGRWDSLREQPTVLRDTLNRMVADGEGSLWHIMGNAEDGPPGWLMRRYEMPDTATRNVMAIAREALVRELRGEAEPNLLVDIAEMSLMSEVESREWLTANQVADRMVEHGVEIGRLVQEHGVHRATIVPALERAMERLLSDGRVEWMVPEEEDGPGRWRVIVEDEGPSDHRWQAIAADEPSEERDLLLERMVEVIGAGQMTISRLMEVLQDPTTGVSVSGPDLRAEVANLLGSEHFVLMPGNPPRYQVRHPVVSRAAIETTLREGYHGQSVSAAEIRALLIADSFIDQGVPLEAVRTAVRGLCEGPEALVERTGPDTYQIARGRPEGSQGPSAGWTPESLDSAVEDGLGEQDGATTIAELHTWMLGELREGVTVSFDEVEQSIGRLVEANQALQIGDHPDTYRLAAEIGDQYEGLVDTVVVEDAMETNMPPEGRMTQSQVVMAVREDVEEPTLPSGVVLAFLMEAADAENSRVVRFTDVRDGAITYGLVDANLVNRGLDIGPWVIEQIIQDIAGPAEEVSVAGVRDALLRGDFIDSEIGLHDVREALDQACGIEGAVVQQMLRPDTGQLTYRLNVPSRGSQQGVMARLREMSDELPDDPPVGTAAQRRAASRALMFGQTYGAGSEAVAQALDGPRDLLRHPTLGPMAREDIQRRESAVARLPLRRMLYDRGMQLVDIVRLMGLEDDASAQDRIEAVLVDNPEFIVDGGGRWSFVGLPPEGSSGSSDPRLWQHILDLFPKGNEVLTCGDITDRLRTGPASWPSDTEVREALGGLIKVGCLIFIHDQHTAGYRLLKRSSGERPSALDRLKGGGLDL